MKHILIDEKNIEQKEKTYWVKDYWKRFSYKYATSLSCETNTMSTVSHLGVKELLEFCFFV